MAINPNMTGITCSSDHQYVVIDTSSPPSYKIRQHLPMTFWIDYSRVNGGNTDSNIPVLTLLINPENMTINMTKKIAPSYARDGYIIETWGEEQDVIQCSGKIGGYYIAKGNGIQGPESMSGLNRYGRSKSLSFKNIYKLLYIFRNNGAIYQNTTKEESNSKLMSSAGYLKIKERAQASFSNANNRIDRVGDVFLNYDQTKYMGSFDTFSMVEDANTPYTLEFSFQFTVQRRYVSDSRNFEHYRQTSYENSLVKDPSGKNVKTVVKNAISVQRDARNAEKGNLNNTDTNEVDTPVPEGDMSSKVSPDTLARSGVGLMRSNYLAPTYGDYQNIKKAIEKIDTARSTKVQSLEVEGKNQLSDTIYAAMKREVVIVDGKSLSTTEETELREKANNLADIMIQDLPNPN